MKLVDIVKIWEDGYNPSDIQKEIVNHRANTCDGCDKLKFNDSGNFFFCGACGCPMGNKIFYPMQAKDSGTCPLNKWEK
jgi:hypothetical protein